MKYSKAEVIYFYKSDSWGVLEQIKLSFDTVQHLLTNLCIKIKIFSSSYSHFLCYDWNITWFTLCNGWYLASIYTHYCCYWNYFNHITQEHVLSCSCYLQVRNIWFFVLLNTVLLMSVRNGSFQTRMLWFIDTLSK